MDASFPGRYLAYPHCGGFVPGTDSLVLGRLEDDGRATLVLTDAEGRETPLTRPLARTPGGDPVWFDVALAAPRLAAVAEGTLWILDLDGNGALRPLFSAREGEELGGLPGLRPDGRRVVAGLRRGREWSVLEIDADTGEAETLFAKPWHANHLHYSPRDPGWIGFCHEGPAEEVRDRVWGWHRSHAPEGTCLFDQAPSGLCLGHERWAFHAPSAIVVAYGVSPGEPRGLYELFPDGSRPRLVSAGNRDWHVDVSRDGRRAVVDTTGPHDAPGRGWEGADGVSDIVLVDMATGRRRFLARSRFGPRHPAHPHPCFSPDGAAVYYQEYQPETGGVVVRRVAVPRESGSGKRSTCFRPPGG